MTEHTNSLGLNITGYNGMPSFGESTVIRFNTGFDVYFSAFYTDLIRYGTEKLTETRRVYDAGASRLVEQYTRQKPLHIKEWGIITTEDGRVFYQKEVGYVIHFNSSTELGDFLEQHNNDYGVIWNAHLKLLQFHLL